MLAYYLISLIYFIMKNKIVIISSVILTILLIKNSALVTNSVIYSSKLFITKILPSLFPMFIITSLLININTISDNKIISLVNKIFNINSNQLYILFISLFSGCPSNAAIANEMYENNRISNLNTKKILLFNHFINPLFIINIVPNRKLLVLLSHYISNFIIGLFSRNIYVDDYNQIKYDKNFNINEILINSIKTSTNTLLYVYGVITFCYIITTIINIPILKILIEVTQGINYINSIIKTDKLKIALIGALLSFGGFSIHMQVMGIIEKSANKYFPYLLARLCQALLTFIIILILY